MSKLEVQTALQQNRTMSEVIFDQLKRDIVTGQLVGGDRLVERELTERFQVSRTPMRQALKRLVHSGLAVEIPYRSVMVRSLSHEFARDIYDLRMGIEGLAAFLAAERGTPDHFLEMQQVLDQMDQATEQGQIEEILVLNGEFHASIARATQNSLLQKQMDDLWITVNLTRASAWRGTARSLPSNHEHHAILRAILEHDPHAARAAMEAHVQASWQLVDEKLRQAEEEAAGG